MTVINTALEWSPTAWLTQGDGLVPRQPSRPVCAAALSLFPGEPCPLRAQQEQMMLVTCLVSSKRPSLKLSTPSWLLTTVRSFTGLEQHPIRF